MSSPICADDIVSIAMLARLQVDEQKADKFASNVAKILDMMAVLSDVDTDGVTPLTNVHDMTQPLREDTVDSHIDREQNQAIAPNVADGLYLVPQVIE